MVSVVDTNAPCIKQIYTTEGQTFSAYVGEVSLTTYFDKNPLEQHFIKVVSERIILCNFTNGNPLLSLVTDLYDMKSEVEDLQEIYPERGLTKLEKQVAADAEKPKRGNPFTRYAIIQRAAHKIIGTLSLQETTPGSVNCRLRIHKRFRFQKYGSESLVLAAHLANWISEQGFKTGGKADWKEATFSKPSDEAYVNAYRSLVGKCRAHRDKSDDFCSTSIEKFPKALQVLEKHKRFALKQLAKSPGRTKRGPPPPLPPEEEPPKSPSLLVEPLRATTPSTKRKPPPIKQLAGKDVPLLPSSEYASPAPVPDGIVYIRGRRYPVRYETAPIGRSVSETAPIGRSVSDFDEDEGRYDEPGRDMLAIIAKRQPYSDLFVPLAHRKGPQPGPTVYKIGGGGACAAAAPLMPPRRANSTPQ